jgi:hypothetical protein
MGGGYGAGKAYHIKPDNINLRLKLPLNIEAYSLYIDSR